MEKQWLTGNQHSAAVSILRWAIAWAFLMAAYLVFTNNVGWREWIAGSVVTTLSLTAAYVFYCADPVQFKFRAADLLQGWRIGWNLVLGTWQVFSAAVLRLFTTNPRVGGLYTTPYQEVGNDPLSAARRALAVTYTTATPNSVVLGVDRKHRLLLYHQILPEKVSTMTRNLGAD